MSRHLNIASEMSAIPSYRALPGGKDLSSKGEFRSDTLSRTKTFAKNNYLNQINEDFCKLAQESRRQSSKERLQMLQNIRSTTDIMNSRQLSGAAIICAIESFLKFKGYDKSSSIFENTGSRVLATTQNQQQARIREFEIWFQAEQERIAKSRDDERAHMQKWEQHLQAEHSSRLRFFS